MANVIKLRKGLDINLTGRAQEEASRSLARSKLIGGHSAGGLDGLK